MPDATYTPSLVKISADKTLVIHQRVLEVDTAELSDRVVAVLGEHPVEKRLGPRLPGAAPGGDREFRIDEFHDQLGK